MSEPQRIQMELPALGRLGTWRIDLEEEAAHLEAVQGGARVSIDRANTAGRLELHELLGGHGVLVIPKERDRKKLQFRLTTEQRDAVDAWIGPRTHAHLNLLLRRRYAWGVLLGVLLILLSLPMPGDPAAGLEPVPGSPITAILGAGLVGMWLVARLRPTPKLLILDCVWVLGLVASLVADVVAGRTSPLWLLWGLVLAAFLYTGWREYQRFKHLPGWPF